MPAWPSSLKGYTDPGHIAEATAAGRALLSTLWFVRTLADWPVIYKAEHCHGTRAIKYLDLFGHTEMRSLPNRRHLGASPW